VYGICLKKEATEEFKSFILAKKRMAEAERLLNSGAATAEIIKNFRECHN
jgi:hypothetical protein